MSSPISLPQNLITQASQLQVSKPAETQVTSSEILADAHDIKQTNFKKPVSTIQDLDELRSFQLAKRRDYEQQLNKNRLNYGQWMRYAKWEIDHNHDFKRARSIFERALEVNVQHVPFWVRYIELELLHKNVNHARNLLDRAVTTMPRTDKFWFMFVQTEETLSNFNGVRAIFERWLQWRPSELAWDAYVQFEQRYGEYENARAIFLRYVNIFPVGATWKRWLVFETSLPAMDDVQTARIRGVFEIALDTLFSSKESATDSSLTDILSFWAKWEVSVNEVERARAIISNAIDQNVLSKEQKLELLSNSAKFRELTRSEDSSKAENSSIYIKKKLILEKALAENIRDYDSWWDYAKLQESTLGSRYVIELLEKAVKTLPGDEFKSTSWRRYIFLWIKLALYHEFSARDVVRAREVWNTCLKTIPHQKFTFAKLWIMSAEFELRNGGGISQSRKVLGQGIGQSCKNRPKRKLFKYYVGLESRLGELERVRKVYEKWLESCLIFDKQNGENMGARVLQEYINYERELGESERCVALYDIGITDQFGAAVDLLQPYIEFLKEEFRYDKAREILRARLVKNSANEWIQFALFESSILSPSQMDDLENAESEEVQFQVEEYHLEKTRAIFSEAYNFFKGANDGINAVSVINAWLEYENIHGSNEQAQKVQAKLPKPITKRRTVEGVEEMYTEYEFPEIAPNLSKFLANAKQWASTAT